MESVPLVIDTSTPSCGDSRFGCWVCTLVDKDKSMTAMIQNDSEKEWMEPLLLLRNELDEHDHDKRDFRRMNGHVQLFRDKEECIPGPYTQASRELWLRKLLQAQKAVRENPLTPTSVREIELISLPELHEIRKIWVLEKHEIEDRLPEIYMQEAGTLFPAQPFDDIQPFGAEEMGILKSLCSDDQLHFELIRELLDVERSYRTMARRSNLFGRLERAFRRGFYDNREDAASRAFRRQRYDSLVTDLQKQEVDFSDAATNLVVRLKEEQESKLVEKGIHDS